jgi:hypothetical protein
LAEDTRFAIALASAPALIKPESNKENGNPEKIWPKGADVGRKKPSAARRSSSQYKRKHWQATGQSSQGASNRWERCGKRPFRGGFASGGNGFSIHGCSSPLSKSKSHRKESPFASSQLRCGTLRIAPFQNKRDADSDENEWPNQTTVDVSHTHVWKQEDDGSDQE